MKCIASPLALLPTWSALAWTFVSAGCAIGANDALPSLGRPCVVSAGRCGIEHVCQPDVPGDRAGLCVPVASYGAACGALEPVTHPAGADGIDDTATRELTIDAPEDLPRLEGVRSFAGLLRIQREGAGPPIELGTLCGARDLQQIGEGFGIGRSDLTDLSGLQSLTSIHGGLAIFSNPALSSLAGLENLVDITPRTLEGVAFDIVIAGNGRLTDAVIAEFTAAVQERSGRALEVVACGNQGEPCPSSFQGLAQSLTSTGLPQ